MGIAERELEACRPQRYDWGSPSGAGALDEPEEYDFEEDLKRHLSDLGAREAAEHGYFIEDGCVKRKKISKKRKESVQQLTNFWLKSIRRIIRDDGVERQTLLEIEAVLHGKTFREELPIDEFERMQWPMKVMGPSAMTAPQNGPEVVHVLKLLARKEADKLIYTHIGWRPVDGKPYYLHAGGAVGAEGARHDIKATLPTRKMHAFTLPDPPVGEDEKAAMQASLRLLDVADDLLSVPLFAAVYRAPLGDFGMTLFLSGSTGIFKTATAKLAQQHYGRDFENEENILHFDNGTANGFRESLFAAKDAVCLNRQRVICIPAESFAKAEAGNDERPENAASTESAAIPPRSVPS